MPAARDPDPAGPEAPETLRRLAIEAARVGGELARRSFGKPLSVELKSDRSEVTDADRAAEQAVIEHLRAARPDDVFIGEESVEQRAAATGEPAGARDATDEQARDRVFWIIDPIDGTRNFIRGAPLFGCSVAAMQRGVPIAGAIYDPLRSELYSAAAGCGAFLNDEPLPALRADDPEIAEQRRMLLVAIPSAREPACQPLVHAILDRHVVRNVGCTTMHLTMVAAGRIDAALMNNCKLWDIAAGWVIVSEVGGRMTSPAGDAIFPVDVPHYRSERLPTLAGSPPAHARLLRERREISDAG